VFDMLTMAPRRGMVVALAAAILSGLLFTTAAADPPVASAGISSVETQVVRWLNADRVNRGLRPLRGWGTLYSIAELRAERMAAANVMSHTISGSLSNQLSSAGVRSWSYGENIAYSGYPRGIEAARHIYRMWRNSSIHWSQMMSKRFNYVGIGLAYRSSNGRTFASLVFTESPDHTGAKASMTGGSRQGDDVTWTWRGADTALQTHTAGLRDFDVQYRVDWGSWRLVRDNTTATWLKLYNRPGGHSYALRVRATDRAGNVGPWSPERRVSVP
jgi:uncharacterized protein YkwD